MTERRDPDRQRPSDRSSASSGGGGGRAAAVARMVGGFVLVALVVGLGLLAERGLS